MWCLASFENWNRDIILSSLSIEETSFFLWMANRMTLNFSSSIRKGDKIVNSSHTLKGKKWMWWHWKGRKGSKLKRYWGEESIKEGNREENVMKTLRLFISHVGKSGILPKSYKADFVLSQGNKQTNNQSKWELNARETIIMKFLFCHPLQLSSITDATF